MRSMRVMRRVMTPFAIAPLLGFILLGLSACAVEYEDDVEDIDTAFHDTVAGSADGEGKPWDPSGSATPLGYNHGVGSGSNQHEVSVSLNGADENDKQGEPIPIPWTWKAPEDGERDDQGSGEHEPKP
jgi:hypothetical protein